MNPIKRLQKLASKSKSEKFGHVHVAGGIAYACDEYAVYSTPAEDMPDCPHDCGWPGLPDVLDDITSLVEVSHTHLKRAVKMAVAIYNRENEVARDVQISGNGHLEVFAAYEKTGQTCCTLAHQDTWRERSRGGWNGKTSEVYYQKAGDDFTAYLNGKRVEDALMLMQDMGAELVEIEAFNFLGGSVGCTFRSGNTFASLAPKLQPSWKLD